MYVCIFCVCVCVCVFGVCVSFERLVTASTAGKRSRRISQRGSPTRLIRDAQACAEP